MATGATHWVADVRGAGLGGTDVVPLTGGLALIEPGGGYIVSPFATVVDQATGDIVWEQPLEEPSGRVGSSSVVRRTCTWGRWRVSGSSAVAMAPRLTFEAGEFEPVAGGLLGALGSVVALYALPSGSEVWRVELGTDEKFFAAVPGELSVSYLDGLDGARVFTKYGS